jgi:LacI family transcriptional regulator
MAKHAARRSKRITARVTIHDVAAKAGVSTSTVSRVLNDRGYASEETVARVLQAAQELNYVPHTSARGLVSQRTNMLGFAARDLATLFLPPLLTSIEATFRAAGFNLLISTSISSPGQVPPLGEHNTDGILVFADAFSDEQLQHLADLEFPIVLVHRRPPAGLEFPTVNIENIASTRALITHLIVDHGCCRVAFLAGPEKQTDALERMHGYRLALEEQHIPFDPDLVRRGDFSGEVARATLQEWLATDGVMFDAVFAGDDEAAIATIEVLQAAGIHVPQDVAVVGFDNELRAPYITPSLTTVEVPFGEVGRAAAQRLIQLVQHGEADSIILPTEVVVRQSCGCE